MSEQETKKKDGRGGLRLGSGRPRNERKNVHLRLDPDVIEILKNNQHSKSDYVNNAIRHYEAYMSHLVESSRTEVVDSL